VVVGSFRWSSVAFGSHAVSVHRKIAITLGKAHERMVDAHVASGLRTNHVYGNMFRSVYETLVVQFENDINHGEGVGTVRVRGYDFLIVNGWLIYPLRYADSYKEPYGATIRPSKLRQAVLTELGPESAQQPLTPDLDEPADDDGEPPSLPDVLEELKDSLKVAVVAFTSSVSAGVIQAYVGQPELDGDRLVWHGRIDHINLVVPPQSGEGGSPAAGPTGPGPAPDVPRFGQGDEPEVSLDSRPRPGAPPSEPEAPSRNIQNDE
jgi:hypothetical protein